MRRFGTFARDNRGAVGYIFGLAAVPLIGFVGLAVDYSRAEGVRATMQSAADSTVLMLAREAPKKSAGQLQILAEPYYKAVMSQHPDIATSGLAVNKSDNAVGLSATGYVKTYFAGIFGMPGWAIDVSTEAHYGTRKIEVALVLDNTGSMQQQNKIGELKKASHTLLKILESSAVKADQIKVALVPYTTRVNLGTAYKEAAWLTTSPTGTFEKNDASYSVAANRNTWQGCVADRDKGYNNSVQPVGVLDQSKYPMLNCADGLAQAMPLTANFSALHKRVDEMKASGWTNITLGAQWGFEMLSGAAPFSETSTDKNTERFMILLTDGNNTVDRWTKKGQEGTGANETVMDKDTKAMCDAITERGVATSAKVHKIRLYTVLVIDGNESLLKSCASSPDMFKKVKQASELESVFKAIAEEIGGLRLTM